MRALTKSGKQFDFYIHMDWRVAEPKLEPSFIQFQVHTEYRVRASTYNILWTFYTLLQVQNFENRFRLLDACCCSAARFTRTNQLKRDMSDLSRPQICFLEGLPS